jgi:hypothetical protein
LPIYKERSKRKYRLFKNMANIGEGIREYNKLKVEVLIYPYIKWGLIFIIELMPKTWRVLKDKLIIQ